MNKILVLLFVGCTALAVALSRGGHRGDTPLARQQRSVAAHVGLLLDVGGLGDRSFNDLAYAGLRRAENTLAVDMTYIEPAETADGESALRQFAAGPQQLIIAAGYLFTDDVNAVAADYPAKMFVGIDYATSPQKTVPPNVVAVKFREHEGSFLVGAVAGLVSRSGVVGFVGGMNVPIIQRFEAGYRAGVQAVRPAARVLTGYAGVTSDAFRNPAKGKALAMAQVAQGADIIFHAAGPTGLGVFEAARERHFWVIGVDGDQYEEAPGYVLTSMVKNVDRAVWNMTRAFLEGSLQGGVVELGLAEDGVGYVCDEHNRAVLDDTVRARVESLKAAIVRGELRVPARLADL